MTPESRLTLAYLGAHPQEAALELERLPAQAAAAVLSPLPAAAIAGALHQLVPYAGARVLEALGPEQGAAALTALPGAGALALLRALPAPLREGVLAHLPAGQRGRLTRSLAFAPYCAGALADPFVLTMAAAGSVAQALQAVRAEPARATYYLYVLEAGARLVGVTSLKELLTAPDDASLAAVCRGAVATLPAEAGLAELLEQPLWREHHILPVIERGGAFVGALRRRDLQRLETAQATGGPDRLADALMQLWELYSMAGLSLMTGVAAGMDALASGARATQPPAPREDPPREEPPR